MIIKGQFKQEMIRILKYQLTGLVVTAVDFGVYFSLGAVFRGLDNPGRSQHMAQFLSYTVAAVVGYALNRKWTFGSGAKFFGAKLFQYILLNVVILLASLFVLSVSVDALGLHGTPVRDLLAKGIVSAATAVLNYCGIRFWIFRKPGRAAK